MYIVECTSLGRYTQAESLNFVCEDYLIVLTLEGSSFPPPLLLGSFRRIAGWLTLGEKEQQRL